MQQGRGGRLRITSIRLGKKEVPVDFTVSPGEEFSLRFEGDSFVVVRELRFPIAAQEPQKRNGRRKYNRKEKKV